MVSSPSSSSTNETAATSPYGPIELKLLEKLSDGEAHNKEELIQCIDKFASKGDLAVYICNLRKKLLPLGETIVCETRYRVGRYRHVRLLKKPEGTSS